MKITLFIDKRHVKDILRSLSHELVHHAQNCRGDFDKGHDLGEGNFTTNKALQKLELEAYAEGNGKIVREFEDWQKQQIGESIMKKNAKRRIVEDKDLWAAEVAADKDLNNDGWIGEPNKGKKVKKVDESEDLGEDVVEEGDDDGPSNEPEGDQGSSFLQKQQAKQAAGKSAREMGGGRLDQPSAKAKKSSAIGAHRQDVNKQKGDALVRKQAAAGKKRAKDAAERAKIDKATKTSIAALTPDAEVVAPTVPPVKGAKDRKAAALKKHRDAQTAKTATGPNENWARGNKDQLLFERLMKKWAK